MMIFGKWKKRAYDQLEISNLLEEENKKLKINLDEIATFSAINPIMKEIINIKYEMEKQGKQPKTILASPDVILSINQIAADRGIIQTFDSIFGLTVLYSQEHRLRLEE